LCFSNTLTCNFNFWNFFFLQTGFNGTLSIETYTHTCPLDDDGKSFTPVTASTGVCTACGNVRKTGNATARGLPYSRSICNSCYNRRRRIKRSRKTKQGVASGGPGRKRKRGARHVSCSADVSERTESGSAPSSSRESSEGDSTSDDDTDIGEDVDDVDAVVGEVDCGADKPPGNTKHGDAGDDTPGAIDGSAPSARMAGTDFAGDE
jgi:hypothetical protein